MGITQTIKKIMAGLLSSPIKIDFSQRGKGSGYIQEVAPYPPQVMWDPTIPILKTSNGLEYVQTPSERFENLPGYDYKVNYLEIEELKMHYLDEGPRDGEIILMLHGQPVWSYLYRKMIKGLVSEGYRCIVPDMIGMGKSDKPIKEAYHTYDQHCDNTLTFIKKLGIKDITIFIQDWGSLIGTRLVGENPDLFARVVLANGDLPTFTEETNPFYIPNPLVVNSKLKGLKPAIAKHAVSGMVDWFQAWILFCLQHTRNFVGEVMKLSTVNTLTSGEVAAYEAPFPSFIYMAGPRTLPSMNAGIRGQTAAAWQGLQQFEKPFLSLIGLQDKLLGRPSIQKKWIAKVPGAKGQNHEQFKNANHFIQEDIGEIMADRTHKFILNNPA